MPPSEAEVRRVMRQIDGLDPARPEDLQLVLWVLANSGLAFAEMKQALLRWLNRAGLKLELWMVKYLEAVPRPARR